MEMRHASTMPCSLTSRSICCASSLVGAKTRPIGPSPGLIEGWFKQCCTMGMLNDAVLPEPVSAHPRMSRPLKAIGMPWDWMGVGCWYLWSVMSAFMLACKIFERKPGKSLASITRRLRIAWHSPFPEKTRSEPALEAGHQQPGR